MDLETRVARLEAESQIRQLISSYSFSIDNREIDRIRALFTDDATVRSQDGVMNAMGADAIVELYRERFRVLGAGAHYMHDLRLEFLDDALTEARGEVSGHAELARNGQMMVTALRYADLYRNTSAGWRIHERTISFLYYVPVADYPEVLLTQYRNRAYAEPKLADFPETIPGWEDFRSIPDS